MRFDVVKLKSQIVGVSAALLMSLCIFWKLKEENSACDVKYIIELQILTVSIFIFSSVIPGMAGEFNSNDSREGSVGDEAVKTPETVSEQLILPLLSKHDPKAENPAAVSVAVVELVE